MSFWGFIGWQRAGNLLVGSSFRKASTVHQNLVTLNGFLVGLWMLEGEAVMGLLGLGDSLEGP